MKNFLRYLHSKNYVSSYCYKKGTAVSLLSTIHNIYQTDTSIGNKPRINLHCNKGQ